MGSYSIKKWIKYLFYYKWEETGHIYSLDKAKQKSSSANNSMLNIWDSLMMHWAAPGGSGHLSDPSRSSTYHLSSRPQPAPFHRVCCSWWPSLKWMGSLFWALFRNVSPSVQCQASALSMTLHDFETNTTQVTLAAGLFFFWTASSQTMKWDVCIASMVARHGKEWLYE